MAELNIEDEITRAKRGMMWVKLEESLDGAGCPVCSQVGRSEAHYLESMLYEYVLDAGVRKKLHHSHGFCTRHAAIALEAENRLNSDGLHVATMYDSVLDEGLRILKNQIAAVGELEKGKRRRRPEKQVHPTHASKCFVCEFAAEAEAGAVHGILYFSHDRDFLKLYAASKAIICFKHIESLFGAFQNLIPVPLRGNSRTVPYFSIIKPPEDSFSQSIHAPVTSAKPSWFHSFDTILTCSSPRRI